MSDLKYGAPGPWDDEPDEDDFEACGLKCAMRRHPVMGHWCGHVGVPPDHPCFGKDKSQLADFDVHGGITFFGEGDSGNVLGFNCGHLRDLSPGLDVEYHRAYETYRDYGYVRAECERLAAQLAVFGKEEKEEKAMIEPVSVTTVKEYRFNSLLDVKIFLDGLRQTTGDGLHNFNFMDEAGNKVTATLRLVAEYANEREDPISVAVQLGRVKL